MSSPLRFTDYPSKEHQKDYRPAREYLTQKASEITGLMGLYEYGSVAAPGISDIDLIAVIGKDIEKLQMAEFLSGTQAPPYVTRVLDQGTIKPMSQQLFERVQVFGAINSNPIYAPQPITPDTPIESDKILIDAANVVDWLPERILMLRSLLIHPTLSCRRVLGGLGSFRHSASTVNKILGYEPEQSTEFSNAYDDLRANWFNQTEKANFDSTLNLINQGITTGESLITLVTDRLLALGIFRPDEAAADSIFWLDPTKALVFRSPDQNPLTLEESSDVLVQSIPPAWLSAFTIYASAPGEISSLISTNLDLSAGYSQHKLSSEFATILDERIGWINESFEFLNPLGLVKLMYRFAHLRVHQRNSTIRS
jgi:hypothetical protein